MTITAESRPKRIEHEESRMRDVGDEILAYDRESGKVHVLNETARFMYARCDGRSSVGEIAGRIAEEYDVDPDTALTDLLATLEQLQRLGLVDVGS